MDLVKGAWFDFYEYYLQHNGDKIRLCIFTVDEEEFGVAKIVELKYGNCSFEKIVKND